jgi:hypothetical protein
MRPHVPISSKAGLSRPDSECYYLTIWQMAIFMHAIAC